MPKHIQHIWFVKNKRFCLTNLAVKVKCVILASLSQLEMIVSNLSPTQQKGFYESRMKLNKDAKKQDALTNSTYSNMMQLLIAHVWISIIGASLVFPVWNSFPSRSKHAASPPASFPQLLMLTSHNVGIHTVTKTSQELRMLSLSLFIQGSLWMFRLLFSIVRNVSVSRVSRIVLWGCSSIVIVFVFFIVFVIVYLLVRSCLLITLITCLKGQKSLGSLFEGFL